MVKYQILCVGVVPKLRSPPPPVGTRFFFNVFLPKKVLPEGKYVPPIFVHSTTPSSGEQQSRAAVGGVGGLLPATDVDEPLLPPRDEAYRYCRDDFAAEIRRR